MTRGPEIAPFLTSPTRPITKAGYADLCERAKPLLIHTDGLGLETMINELHAFEIHCQFVTPEDAERINAMLAGMVGIGRFEAARSSFPNMFVAVRYLSRHGKPIPYLTLNDELVLIDIRPYDSPLIPDLAEPENSQARSDRAAASLPRIYAAALGEMYWRQMSGDQKSDFNARFWRSVASLPTTTQHPGRTLFTEAFVIAVLYPSTFESEPVGTFTVPSTRPLGPISGELLDRVRYVDVLLDHVEQDILKTIPESAYQEPAPSDE